MEYHEAQIQIARTLVQDFDIMPLWGQEVMLEYAGYTLEHPNEKICPYNTMATGWIRRAEAIRLVYLLGLTATAVDALATASFASLMQLKRTIGMPSLREEQERILTSLKLTK